MIRKSSLTLLMILALTAASRAATVTSTFEDLGLGPNSSDSDADGTTNGFFTSGGSKFNNNIDQTYGSWSGFAISSITSTALTGFGNELGVMSGGGAGGSQTFAVAETFTYPSLDPFNPPDSFINLAANTTPKSVEVNNSTYAYTSMSIGDSFVGPPFHADDFLRLDVTGYDALDGGGASVGAVHMYLANFQNGNSSYVTTWTLVDLSSLVGAKSLRIGLESSRFNGGGMTTPAYVAIDNLTLTLVPEPSGIALAALAGTLAVLLGRRRRRLAR